VAARSQKGIRAARLAAAKADVIAQIGRGHLTIADIAARQRITPRSLQRLFEDEGSTFSAFKLEQQLQCVRRLLASRAHLSWTITSLAYAGGFADLSYFHRSFRRRFGLTPSEFRGDLEEPD
jgi:AraC-like DNA-binding protein